MDGVEELTKNIDERITSFIIDTQANMSDNKKLLMNTYTLGCLSVDEKEDNWNNLSLQAKTIVRRHVIFNSSEEHKNNDVLYLLEELFGQHITEPIFLFNVHINKWSLSLINKLEQLGYFVDINAVTKERTDLFCHNGKVYSYPINSDEYIDVDNEDAFLGIAAIQAGSDINQWYVDTFNNEWYKEENNHFCSKHLSSIGNWHKASPEEIINKFKTIK